MKRGNRYQEALTSYLRVIERRGDDAPESHLEVGLIYLHHIRDPIAAIYHFRRYIALRPNSQQASLVRQRIDAAIREFAKSIPAQPLESQVQRVDLIAAMDKLKLENERLKQQLADLQAGRTSRATARNHDADDSEFNLSLDGLPTVHTRDAPSRSQPSPTTTRSGSPPLSAFQRQASTNTARLGPRRHIVRAGDTLMKISLEYYGSRSRWREIYAANRSVMQSEADLKIGMEIVIPQ